MYVMELPWRYLTKNPEIKKKKRGPTRDPDKVASTLEEWYEISTERNSMVGNELGPSTIG